MNPLITSFSSTVSNYCDPILSIKSDTIKAVPSVCKHDPVGLAAGAGAVKRTLPGGGAVSWPVIGSGHFTLCGGNNQATGRQHISAWVLRSNRHLIVHSEKESNWL